LRLGPRPSDREPAAAASARCRGKSTAAAGAQARGGRASSGEDKNGAPPPGAGGDLKEALLAEIRRVKKFFYGTVVAQTQKSRSPATG